MTGKIGILIDRLNVGGVEKIALEEVIALRELGVDAELVVLRRKAVVENAFVELQEKAPITYLDDRMPRIMRISVQLPMFHFFSTFHLTYPLLLPFFVKKGEYKYLVPHGTYTILSAIALKKVKKIKFSAFIWDPSSYILQRVYKKDANKFLYRFLSYSTKSLDRFIIKNADRILVGGDAHNKTIKSINPDKPIDIIYPSVHPISKRPKKKAYILMATAWKRGKNPEYIINLASHLPDIKIKMAGRWLDPHYRAEFEELINKNKLSSKIELSGEVSEDELSKLYSEALFVLQTNDDKGFGMPALEAAGRGTTFVIPKGQGVCKLFKDRKHGYYTAEGDTKQISKIAGYLVKNPKVAEMMGAEALEKVLANYSWQRHAEQLLKVITAEVG